MADTNKPTIEDVNQTLDKLGNAVGAFETAHAKWGEEVETIGKASAETDAKIEAIVADMVKYDEVMADIRAKMDRPEFTLDGKETEDAINEILKGQFNQYIRKGFEALEDETLTGLVKHHRDLVAKGLTESVNPTAGFLVRPEQSNEIIKSVNEQSPIRSIARIISIGSLAYEIPKRTAQFTATWASETGGRDETTGLAYGEERIPVHILHARVDVTHNLLEDSFVNIESELNTEFAEQFALAEGTAFVTGTGIGRPEGFNVNAAVLAASTTSATNDAIDADDYRELLYNQLKEPYHANSTWVMNRTTLGATMKLKDGNGQYLLQPGMQLGAPSLILGRPYILATDMPAIANGAEALALGDFKKGYMIVDRVGISVQRVEDTQTIEAGGVAIFARKRVGGQVINAEAIKLLTIQ